MSRSPLERRLERLSARCASRRPFVFPRGVVSSDASGLAFTSPSVASPAHRRAGGALLTPPQRSRRPASLHPTARGWLLSASRCTALATLAHESEVLFCDTASLPQRDDVVEPHTLLASAPDTRSVVASPHVQLHPGRGQRVSGLCRPVPPRQARVWPGYGLVCVCGCKKAGKTSQKL